MAKRNQAGGGIGSRVNVEKPVRVGDRSRNVNERGVSQIGQQLSNHATEGSSKLGRAAENVYGGRAPQGGPGGIKLGNEVELNVQGGGPGTGRELYGQSGSNRQYGTSPAGLPRIADTKGTWPDTNTKPR
jgi:hypothetical protein